MTRYIFRKDGIIEINLNIEEDIIDIQPMSSKEFLNLNSKWVEFLKVRIENKPVHSPPRMDEKSEFLKEISTPKAFLYSEMVNLIDKGSLEKVVLNVHILLNGELIKINYVENSKNKVCFFKKSTSPDNVWNSTERIWYLIKDSVCGCPGFRYRKTCKHINMVKDL